MITGCIKPPKEEKNGEPPEEDYRDYYFLNTPTWDATYIKENIMDQFTAGLATPDVSLFNVTSDDLSDSRDPPAYWRLGSLNTYEYSGKAPYNSDWYQGDLLKRNLSPVPVEPNDTFSRIIPPQSRSARYSVSIPVNLSRPSSLATIHPNFVNTLPVPSNGRFGSYVSSDSLLLTDSDMNYITPIQQRIQEFYPKYLKEDLVGINTDLVLDDTYSGQGELSYTVDYQIPNIQDAAAYSLMRTDSDYLKCNLDSNTWESIKTLYLQLPQNLPNGISTYQEWAPTVFEEANLWSDETLTVFSQVYENMREFSDQGFTFDIEMGLRHQLGSMPHPDEYEDYNEWFMQRRSGVSVHFASTLALINRLQGIPSRIAIGYFLGNDSYVYGGKRAFTFQFLHAWTESLVPVDPIPEFIGDEYVEWISFDPLLPYLAHQYGLEIPSDIVTTVSAENHIFIRPDYNLDENGLAQASIDHIHAQLTGDWIFDKCIVNNSQFENGSTLHDGDSVNISVRLIGIPSVANWLPIQGANISFYLGMKEDNTSEWIENHGVFLGAVFTDSSGVTTLVISIDILEMGIRTIHFWTVVKFNEGTPQEYTQRAMSFAYVITF